VRKLKRKQNCKRETKKDDMIRQEKKEKRRKEKL
jgi:hypothetical protein